MPPLKSSKGNNTPATAEKSSPSENATRKALAQAKQVFHKHYYYSDDNAIDLTLGILATNHLKNDPVWLQFISPPSGGKTELLLSLLDHPDTYFLSDLTPNTLISGYKDAPKKVAEGEREAATQDYSLLPLLDGLLVIIKDYSVIHDKPAETRGQILAILRDVYDGLASRGFGNMATKEFRVRFNLLVGMTPDLEKMWSLNTLGERFLLYRINVNSRREHARRGLETLTDPSKDILSIRRELQSAVRKFLAVVPKVHPRASNDLAERTIDLAEILATCRTHVARDYNDEMTSPPQAELATRVSKQLFRVGMSLAAVRGKDVVEDEEFVTMRKVAFDSLPTNRWHILHSLWSVAGVPMNIRQVAAKTPALSEKTIKRELNNLFALGVVRRELAKAKVLNSESTGSAHHYWFTDEFSGYCQSVGGVPEPPKKR